jgi:hypothetical protein
MHLKAPFDYKGIRYIPGRLVNNAKTGRTGQRFSARRLLPESSELIGKVIVYAANISRPDVINAFADLVNE